MQTRKGLRLCLRQMPDPPGGDIMKKTLTSLAVAASLMAAPAVAKDKLLLKTPIAFSTELPGLGSPIPRVAEQLDLMSGGTLKMKVYEPGKLVPPFDGWTDHLLSDRKIPDRD